LRSRFHFLFGAGPLLLRGRWWSPECRPARSGARSSRPRRSNRASGPKFLPGRGPAPSFPCERKGVRPCLVLSAPNRLCGQRTVSSPRALEMQGTAGGHRRLVLDQRTAAIPRADGEMATITSPKLMSAPSWQKLIDPLELWKKQAGAAEPQWRIKGGSRAQLEPRLGAIAPRHIARSQTGRRGNLFPSHSRLRLHPTFFPQPRCYPSPG